ncbi:MAG: TetR/AcrR family transcriptional regulator [Dehalococcoidia bacterium]
MSKFAPMAGETVDREVRDRIFESALVLFSERGYAATSLREIAEKAQTTKPMIYYYFGSKEELYSSIVRHVLEEMAEAIVSTIPGEAQPSDQVMEYCRVYLHHFHTHEEIIALVLREVFGLGGVPMAALGQTLSHKVRQPLDEILRRGMETGEFVQDNVATCATAITGILNMFILAHVFGGAPFEEVAPLHQVRYYVAGLIPVR